MRIKFDYHIELFYWKNEPQEKAIEIGRKFILLIC